MSCWRWSGRAGPDESGATTRVPLESGLIQSALDLELSEGSVVADTLAGERGDLPFKFAPR